MLFSIIGYFAYFTIGILYFRERDKDNWERAMNKAGVATLIVILYYGFLL